MGHVPVPPRPTSAAAALALYERRWKRAAYGRPSWRPWARDRWVAGRWSVLPSRRRAAHDAVLALIKAREALLGMRPDPWAPTPPPKTVASAAERYWPGPTRSEAALAQMQLACAIREDRLARDPGKRSTR